MSRLRWLLPPSSVATLLMSSCLLPTVASGQDRGPWGMPMMGNGWGISMMLMMSLFWAAVMVAIILVIRWLITSGKTGA